MFLYGTSAQRNHNLLPCYFNKYHIKAHHSPLGVFSPAFLSNTFHSQMNLFEQITKLNESVTALHCIIPFVQLQTTKLKHETMTI